MLTWLSSVVTVSNNLQKHVIESEHIFVKNFDELNECKTKYEKDVK